MLILGGKVFQVIRKIYVTILSVVVAVFLLVGCGQANNARTRDKQAPDVSSQGQQLVQDSESAGQERVEDVQDKDHESAGEADGDFPSVEEPPAEDGDLPVVYMTTEISAESLMAVYEALGASPSGRIAVKLSTGEPGSNYLRTDLIGDFVMSFEDPTIVECNTAYGGSRANTACSVLYVRIGAAYTAVWYIAFSKRVDGTRLCGTGRPALGVRLGIRNQKHVQPFPHRRYR